MQRALDAVRSGEVSRYEYRIVRPIDGTVRRLRDTSFPIRDARGEVTGVGGIAEDLTQDGDGLVYIVSPRAADARRLATLIRSMGHNARTFDNPSAFLDLAPVLAPGCVLIDLRKIRSVGLYIPRELKAKSIGLAAIVLDAPDADVASAVAAMKAGATEYVTDDNKEALRDALANAIAECRVGPPRLGGDETATARIERLTLREREVLVGLVQGGTNKSIGKALSISPRTVELHRAQLMNRLDANNLTELLQIALAAGYGPAEGRGRNSPLPRQT